MFAQLATDGSGIDKANATLITASAAYNMVAIELKAASSVGATDGAADVDKFESTDNSQPGVIQGNYAWKTTEIEQTVGRLALRDVHRFQQGIVLPRLQDVYDLITLPDQHALLRYFALLHQTAQPPLLIPSETYSELLSICYSTTTNALAVAVSSARAEAVISYVPASSGAS